MEYAQHKRVELQIFNAKGQKVDTISNVEITNSINQQIIWNATNHASGIYFYKVKVGEKESASRMLLLK